MRWFVFMCTVIINNVSGENVTWQLYSAVSNLTIGPETAVHCQLTSPTGTVTFDDFGPCKVNIDRVTAKHSGAWTLSLIQPNKMLAVEQTFTVEVDTGEINWGVISDVVQKKSLPEELELTCAIVRAAPLTACVFRDPAGRVLQARQGIAESRYSFVESSIYGAQYCGIDIKEPQTSDLGLWRCDMKTTTNTYYGHLSVLCARAMQDPEIAENVVSVPTLVSRTKDQVFCEGDSVTMSCSIQSVIRYCYFRDQNGTIFNVRPGMTSSSVEYAGAGFEAGECGARFSGLRASDSGRWSCHVALKDRITEPEQRVQFSIQVNEAISANQYSDRGEVVVEGVVYGSPTLEYCRFVRTDGQGFNLENMPTGYTDHSSRGKGICKMRVDSPTVLDHQPWTVVAKVVGQDDELAQYTDHTTEMPPPGT